MQVDNNKPQKSVSMCQIRPLRCRVPSQNQVLAQLDYCGNLMMTKAFKDFVCLLPTVLHEKLAKLHVLALCSELTVLTQEPAASIGVKVESPFKGSTLLFFER